MVTRSDRVLTAMDDEILRRVSVLPRVAAAGAVRGLPFGPRLTCVSPRVILRIT